MFPIIDDPVPLSDMLVSVVHPITRVLFAPELIVIVSHVSSSQFEKPLSSAPLFTVTAPSWQFENLHISPPIVIAPVICEFVTITLWHQASVRSSVPVILTLDILTSSNPCTSMSHVSNCESLIFAFDPPIFISKVPCIHLLIQETIQLSSTTNCIVVVVLYALLLKTHLPPVWNEFVVLYVQEK